MVRKILYKMQDCNPCRVAKMDVVVSLGKQTKLHR